MAIIEKARYSSLFEKSRKTTRTKRGVSRETQELVKTIKKLKKGQAFYYTIEEGSNDSITKLRARLGRAAKMCGKRLRYVVSEDRVAFALAKSSNVEKKSYVKNVVSEEERESIVNAARRFKNNEFSGEDVVDNLPKDLDFGRFPRIKTVISAVLRNSGFERVDRDVYKAL